LIALRSTLTKAAMKSVDGGSNWIAFGNGIPSAGGNLNYNNTAIAAVNGTIAFVLQNDSYLLRTTDGGLSWNNLNRHGPISCNATDLAWDDLNATLYVATEEGEMFSCPGLAGVAPPWTVYGAPGLSGVDGLIVNPVPEMGSAIAVAAAALVAAAVPIVMSSRYRVGVGRREPAWPSPGTSKLPNNAMTVTPP
jgi:hypothetical protein